MNRHRDRSRKSRGTLSRSVTAIAALALVGGTLAAAGSTAVAASVQRSVTATPLVFDGVTVVDVEQGKLVPDQRVVIVGNRIQAVGSSRAVRLPKGAQVVDARGKYLIPGLWDLHTHSRRYTDFFYPLFIANGVTGIRDAASEVPLDTLIRWRREIVAGTRVGPPRQILSGQAIDEDKACARQKALQTCVADSADARHLVDSLKAAGVDMIKTYDLTKTMYFVIAAETRRLRVPFGGHIHAPDLAASEASDSGAGILDHPNTSGGLDALCLGDVGSVEQCQPVAERLAHNGTWFVPTIVRALTEGMDQMAGPRAQSIFARFQVRASEFWAGSKLRGNWLHDSAGVGTPQAPGKGTIANSPGFMSVIQRVGLPILAGTDAGAPVMQSMPPGFALHAELAMYVADGLTPLDALQSATLNPAKFLHATDSLGTVASGKLADLVLLDADPLADITNTTTVWAVVANGRYFDRATLDQLLAKVQAAAKQEPEPFGQAR